MSIDTDIAVVGAGPAGLAVAISAALRGCRVTLLERDHFPRHRPGESQHPGVAGLLKELGIEDLSPFSPVRHSGIWVTWPSIPKFVPFGGDSSGPWHGYQINRSTLDQGLLAHAKRLGVRILQPCGRAKVFTENDRVAGVRYEHGDVRARFTIDASGNRHWLQKELGLRLLKLSPRLVACYGYVNTANSEQYANPSITSEGLTWTWIAQVDTGLCHWTRLNLKSEFSREIPLDLRTSSTYCSRPLGADVTWRTVQPAAGPGFFLVGDAAAVLDPLASHGVLRALMSGIMVGHLVAYTVQGQKSEEHTSAFYTSWLGEWLVKDIAAMSRFYRQLQPIPEWLNGVPLGNVGPIRVQ